MLPPVFGDAARLNIMDTFQGNSTQKDNNFYVTVIEAVTRCFHSYTPFSDLLVYLIAYGQVIKSGPGAGWYNLRLLPAVLALETKAFGCEPSEIDRIREPPPQRRRKAPPSGGGVGNDAR